MAALVSKVHKLANTTPTILGLMLPLKTKLHASHCVSKWTNWDIINENADNTIPKPKV